jgi:hypothetical protein
MVSMNLDNIKPGGPEDEKAANKVIDFLYSTKIEMLLSEN